MLLDLLRGDCDALGVEVGLVLEVPLDVLALGVEVTDVEEANIPILPVPNRSMDESNVSDE